MMILSWAFAQGLTHQSGKAELAPRAGEAAEAPSDDEGGMDLRSWPDPCTLGWAHAAPFEAFHNHTAPIVNFSGARRSTAALAQERVCWRK